MKNGSSEKPNQPTPISEAPEQSNPWQSLSRTADQDRGAMIIENEDEDYKRTRTQDYEESKQGQSELKLEAAFDKMAESVDAMVAEGKISSEARDELLEKQMGIVIDLIDEVRADYEAAKKEELIDRLMQEDPSKVLQIIEQRKAARMEPASSGEGEAPTTATTTVGEQAPSSTQASAQQVAKAPKKAEPVATPSTSSGPTTVGREPDFEPIRTVSTGESSQSGAAEITIEPISMSRIFEGPEMEELQQQKREELLEQHVSDLILDNARELISKDGELENKKIAKRVVGEEKDKLDVRIAAIEEELAQHGWHDTAVQAQPAQTTRANGAPEQQQGVYSTESHLAQLRDYITTNNIGGAWGSDILLDTAPLSETIKIRNSAWWRELSQSQREEVIKYLKDTEKIANLPYGKGVRDWLTENDWLAESQAPAAAA